ncbi:Hypothetical protein NTJ_03943 [Nesidiocoris tenuis]|uniref:Uncharacterized protein n=1 Tax=Nesidiocoris tenuis TaxID=355587 RepID=A0ABN7AFT5_9HEMI|nr:Hypothetical protein NTJ_03943 [Nesidiocoris tenuis]
MVRCRTALLTSLLLIVIAPTISAKLHQEDSGNKRITPRPKNDSSEVKTKVQRQVSSTESPSSTEPPTESDEEKKTLAQQVADGKYGLIQNELFAGPSKRPGIISYDVNPEVPKDNVNNLGGLEPDEIWLAENHLLVLKGNLFNENQRDKIVWPPIDDYMAPPRQVKIPDMPKVPPPFPVQLRDGGPVEFIKGNSSDSRNSLFPPPFFDPRFGPPPPFFPFPQFLGQNGSGIPKPQGNSSEDTSGGFDLPQFLLRPPPGVGPFPPPFLPPPQNFTELDEDDPRIYYPPPYDFVYEDNYTSFVPPGPLVPGIVLPPPPNFFAPVENKTDSQSSVRGHTLKYSKLKPRPVQNFEKIGKTTKQPSKLQKNTVTVTIVPSTTTAKTIISSTTDGTIQNEIVPIRTLPPNTPVGEWVPIPAPRPFYVSEIRNLANKSKPNRHYGDKDPRQPNIYDDNLTYGYDYTSPRKKGRKYLSHEPPAVRQYKSKPEYNSIAVVTSTTARPFQQTSSIRYSFPSSTYSSVTTPSYFPIYDVRLSSFRKNPAQHYSDYDDKENNEVNTVAPAELYDDVSVKTTPAGFVQSNLDFYRHQFDAPTTFAPIDYRYYDKRIPNHQDWAYPKHNVEVGRGKHTNVGGKHITLPPQTKTEKPPIFEYSYSAPGYGTVESPKIGGSYVQPTTAKPQFANVDSQLAYFQSSSPVPPLKWQVTTPAPIHVSTTAAPYYRDYDEYDVEEYTDKSFSKHSSVNKPQDSYQTGYPTIFGQKLNENDVRGSTTSRNNYRNKARQPNKHRVKFPSSDYYDSSEAPYYQAQASAPDYRPVSKHRPLQQQRYTYPNYLRYSSPAVAAYDDFGGYYGDDEDGQYVGPGHPLDSDTNVNLNRPSSLIEPEAEFIDQSQINRPQQSALPNSNTFISYRLPGSGGHFYFLTPQAIKGEAGPLPPLSPFQQVAHRHSDPGYVRYPYDRRNIYPRAVMKIQQQISRKKEPP